MMLNGVAAVRTFVSHFKALRTLVRHFRDIRGRLCCLGSVLGVSRTTGCLGVSGKRVCQLASGHSVSCAGPGNGGVFFREGRLSR